MNLMTNKMKTIAEEPINPGTIIVYEDDLQIPKPLIGLTKREYFAAMAMQGILAGRNTYLLPEYVAAESIAQADALIEKLNK